MVNKVVRLVDRKKFEVHLKKLSTMDNLVIVRPTYMSICKADQRYYKFERPLEILRKKLPMALIHEAVGRVVFDPMKQLEQGTKVILVPTLSYSKGEVEENYVDDWVFCSSNTDGFMQEVIAHPPDRLVPVDLELPDEILSFFELMSVAYHAIKNFERFSIKERSVIGVWGAGSLGYLVSLFLKALYPDSKIYIVGKSLDKSAYFTHVDEFYTANELPLGFRVQHAFECVGGTNSSEAINQIINVIEPRGTISLLGVSENLVLINTRMALEKGIIFSCNSRSTKKDFENVLSLLRNEENLLVKRLMNLVGEIVTVRNLNDIHYAFEIDQSAHWGKTIIKWEF